MQLIFGIGIIFLSIQISQAVIGVDVAYLTDVFPCMKSNGMSFAIARGYRSYGAIDVDGVQNLKNIKAAGLIADAYVFPCRGKSAAAQMNEFVDYYDALGQEEIFQINQESLDGLRLDEARGMRAGNYSEPELQIKRFLSEEQKQIKSHDEPKENLEQLYGTIWLDVESNPSSGCSWASFNATANCQYVADLVNALQARGKLVGIYSSQYMWTTIMGSKTACTQFTNLPIWYAHYDGVASFSDWATVSFGGWTKPAIKQYIGDTIICNSDADLNFY